MAERIIEAKPAVRPVPDPKHPEIIIPEAQDWSEVSFMPEGIRDENPIPSLRISLMGQGAFGLETYEKLKAQGHSIGVVFAPEGKNPLRIAVEKDIEAGIDVKIHTLTGKKEDLATEEAAKNFNENSPELGVFASMTTIAPKEIYDRPLMGTLIYHNSFLEKGRGGSAMEHALIRGNKLSGISIIKADEGADTGDIILQAPMELYQTDTPFSVNNDTYKAGVQMMVDSVEIAARGKLDLVATPQDKSIDTLEPFLGKLPVDMSKTAEETYNFMRGLMNKKPYIILDADKPRNVLNVSDIAFIPGRKYEKAQPGTLMEITDQGAIYAAGDGGAIRIGTFQESRIFKNKFGSMQETTNKDNIGARMGAKQMFESKEIKVGHRIVIPEQEDA